MKEIKDFKWTGQVKTMNVLFVGQVAAGKSSFFNTLESVFNNYVSSTASSGSGNRSRTTGVKQYRITDDKNESLRLRFFDSAGLEANEDGIQMEDIIQILDGKDSPADKIHCVCFAVECTQFNGMDKAILAKWREIRTEAEKRSMEPLVILTNVDGYCEKTKAKTSNVFYSQKIESKVTEVSTKLGVTARVVHPVVNYAQQRSLVVEIDILALYALREICRKCSGHMD